MQAGLTNPLPHRPDRIHTRKQPLLCTSCMQVACVRQGNSGGTFWCAAEASHSSVIHDFMAAKPTNREVSGCPP
jgi:hypothetical protein